MELVGVTKRFGATVALEEFDFDLRPGGVHALLGESGAGKSTALGLMHGVTSPDEGEVRIGGEPMRLGSVTQAQAVCVSCVFQALSLAKGLSVAENIGGIKAVPAWRGSGSNPLPVKVETGVMPITAENVAQCRH